MISFLRSAYRNCYLLTILFAVLLLINAIRGSGVEYSLYLCCGAFVAAMAFQLWHSIEKQRPGKDNDELPRPDTGVTFDLLEGALTRIGCQPEVRRNDGKISVAYQGENLLFDVRGFYVRIVDYCWSGIAKDDPEPMAKFFAINHANHAFNAKLVYGWNEDGNIEISTYQEFCLYPGTRKLDAHLKLALHQLLQAHKNLDDAFQSIMADRRSGKGGERRPVGFAAAEEMPEKPGESGPTASAHRPVGFTAANEQEQEK